MAGQVHARGGSPITRAGVVRVAVGAVALVAAMAFAAQEGSRSQEAGAHRPPANAEAPPNAPTGDVPRPGD